MISTPLSPSELILQNNDTTPYHVHLLQEYLADTVIAVGDPKRVPAVSKYFDEIENKTSYREIVTHTGRIGKKRFTVISTGMGVGGVDIIINELDALANVDFKTRLIKEKKRSLDIIRVGTCGGVNTNFQIGDYITTEYAIGLANLLHFYENEYSPNELALQTQFSEFLNLHSTIQPTVSDGSEKLRQVFQERAKTGITITSPGFYGPQGRSIRLKSHLTDFASKLDAFTFNGEGIANIDMESSALYGLSKLLGHRACTICIIIANRIKKEFISDVGSAVDELIRYSLEKLSQSE